MTRDRFDLTGKVALVAGASRGIGSEIAVALGEYGAHVIALSRGEGGCDETLDRIRAVGGEGEAKVCHIGKMEQIEGIYQYIDKTHGKLDILVNNAASNPYYGHILDTDLGSFKKTLEVNLQGYFFMSVYAGRRMRETKAGAILNVASINGVSPGDKQGVYSMTKAGIINMTKAFARECGSLGIRVNSLKATLEKIFPLYICRMTIGRPSSTRISTQSEARGNPLFMEREGARPIPQAVCPIKVRKGRCSSISL